MIVCAPKQARSAHACVVSVSFDTNTHINTQAHPHSHTHTLSLSHPHTHTLSLSLTHACTLAHSFTYTPSGTIALQHTVRFNLEMLNDGPVNVTMLLANLNGALRGALGETLNLTIDNIEMLNATFNLQALSSSQALFVVQVTLPAQVVSAFTSTANYKAFYDARVSANNSHEIVSRANRVLFSSRAASASVSPASIVIATIGAFFGRINVTYTSSAQQSFVTISWRLPQPLLRDLAASNITYWYSLQIRQLPGQGMLSSIANALPARVYTRLFSQPRGAASEEVLSPYLSKLLPWTVVGRTSDTALRLSVCTFKCSSACLCVDATYEVRVQLFSTLNQTFTSPSVIVRPTFAARRQLEALGITATPTCLVLNMAGMTDRCVSVYMVVTCSAAK
jgi:hypothetical protein